jgi:U2-associated protein SR140
MPPGLAAMVNKEKEPEKRRDDDRNKDRERGKPRNIDHFMEELKREQEAREKRTADREQRRSDRKSQAAGMVGFCTGTLFLESSEWFFQGFFNPIWGCS